MSFRSALLASVLCAGCATASHANQQHPPLDAPAGVDAPTLRPDASPRPDADVQPPDAALGGCAFTGALATWDLSAQPGNEAQAAATSTVTGVTAGPLSRASGLTAVSGTGSINASGWPTAAQLDATKYFTLSITPPSGCTMALTSMTVAASKSSTGPASGAVATSTDSFAQTTAMSTSSQSTVTLSVTGATGAIELRVYGYGATGTTGTFRIQNTLTVSGSLQ